MSSDPVGRHFDAVAPDYDRWKEKAHRYYDALKASLAEIIPPGGRVIEVGCATGDLLASLHPADGLGIDISPAMIERAARKHPDLRFRVHDLMEGSVGERADYVVAVDVAEHVPDLYALMAALAGSVSARGMVVVMTANPAWAPVLHMAELLRLKMPEGDHQWRSKTDMVSAAGRAGLRERSFDRSLIVPKEIVGIRGLDTARWAAPLRSRFGLIQRLVLEPVPHLGA